MAAQNKNLFWECDSLIVSSLIAMQHFFVLNTLVWNCDHNMFCALKNLFWNSSCDLTVWWKTCFETIISSLMYLQSTSHSVNLERFEAVVLISCMILAYNVEGYTQIWKFDTWRTNKNPRWPPKNSKWPPKGPNIAIFLLKAA